MKEQNQMFRIVKLFGRAVAVAVAVGIFGSAANAQTFVVNRANQTLTGDPSMPGGTAINFTTNDMLRISESTVLISGNTVTAGGGAIRPLYDASTLVIAGNVGTSLNKLQAIEAYRSLTINGNVFLTNGFNLYRDSITVNLNGGLTGNLDFNFKDSTVNLADGQDITGNVSSTGGSGVGTLQLLGNNSISGTVSGINLLKAGADGKTVNFADDVTAGTLFLNGSGTINLNRNLSGDLYYNNKAGTVNLGDAAIITGNVYNTAMQMTPGNALNFLGTGTITGDVTGIDNLRTGVGGAPSAINGTLTMDSGSHLDLGSGTLTLGTLTSPGTMNMIVAATGNGTAFTSSGKIVATAGSMSGNERLAVNMTGGVANGAKFKLIDFANGSNAKTLADGNVTTNSASLTFKAQSGDDAGATLNSSAGITGEDLWVLASYAGSVNPGDGGNTGSGSTPGPDYVSSGNISSNDPAAGAGNALNKIAITGATGATGPTGPTVDQDDRGDKGDMSVVIDTFNMYSAEQLASEIRKLAPISNNSLAEAVTRAINTSLATISGRLRGLRDVQTETSVNSGLASGDEVRSSSFWLKGFGAIGKQDAKDFYNGYKANSAGVMLGADTLIGSSDLRLGAAFSYAGTGVDQQDERTGDSTNIKSSQGTLYASQEFGAAYLDGLLAYARHDYKSHRATALSRTASADWNGTQLSARVDTGYRIPLGATTLTPLASLTWSRLKQDAYTESGAGALSLDVDAASTTRLRSGLGAHVQADTFVGGMSVKPEARLVWFHDFKDAGTDTTSSYTGGGASFSTPGQKLEKDAINVGLGMTVQPNKLARVSLNYDFEGRSGYQAHALQLTGRWDF